MHFYGSQFQLLHFGFDIPKINLLIFMKFWFCGDKEKGHLPLQFLIILDLKNMYMVQ